MRFTDDDWQRYPQGDDGGSPSMTFPLIAILFALMLSSLVAVYSASFSQAMAVNLPGSFFLMKNLWTTLFAIVVALMMIASSDFMLTAVAVLFTIISFCFVVLDAFKTGGKLLSIGLLSKIDWKEVLKASSLISIAAFCKSPSESKLKKYIFPAIIAIASATVMLMDGDFNGFVVYVITAFAVLVFLGIPATWMLLGFAAMISLAILWMLVDAERVKLVYSFFKGTGDPSLFDISYRAVRTAFRDGGLFGVGIGAGIAKLGRLSDPAGNFLLATIAEETGILGLSAVMFMFVAFTVIGFKTCATLLTNDYFGALCAFAATMILALEMLVSFAVITGVMLPGKAYCPFYNYDSSCRFVAIILASLVIRSARKARREGSYFVEDGEGTDWK